MPDPELSDFIDLARSVTDGDRERLAPPPDLWAKISAGAHEGSDLTVAPSTVETSDQTVIDLTAARNRVAPRTLRTRRRQMLVGAVAAAFALIIGFSFFSDDAEPTLIAQTTNAELPEAYDGSAIATVSAGDEPTLTLAFSDALPDDEPIEIWLIKNDFSDMRSLGLLDDQRDTYAVPAGLDLSEFSVVDLSIEPNDGDPTHSGRSILRGELHSL